MRILFPQSTQPLDNGTTKLIYTMITLAHKKKAKSEKFIDLDT